MLTDDSLQHIFSGWCRSRFFVMVEMSLVSDGGWGIMIAWMAEKISFFRTCSSLPRPSQLLVHRMLFTHWCCEGGRNKNTTAIFTCGYAIPSLTAVKASLSPSRLHQFIVRNEKEEEKWFPQWWINYIPQDLSLTQSGCFEMKRKRKAEAGQFASWRLVALNKVKICFITQPKGSWGCSWGERFLFNY